MRLPAVVAVALVALVTPPPPMAAQPAPGPAIQSVTLDPDTGVIRIAGTGLGPDLVVVVDGQLVTVLPGATVSQIEVLAPGTVLTTPGTFRLIVVDPVRQVGDAFVVASLAGRVAGGSPSLAEIATSGPPAERGTPPAPSGTPVLTGAAATVSQSASAPSPNAVIEDTGAPFRTKIGAFALAFTTGDYNTAAGFQALMLNSSGTSNTASGANALLFNTTGGFNTANGVAALRSNTSAVSNTATGYAALTSNTVGSHNTAVGTLALESNTSATGNTAVGADALRFNSIGQFNAALGNGALRQATGSSNVAVGNGAGSLSTGSFNVFLGAHVFGTASDVNTMRLGLPYTSATGEGQNRTFVAGIYGTQLTAPAQVVFVDANGQLGTLSPPPNTGFGVVTPGAAPPIDPALLSRRLEEQQRLIADLRARLAVLEAERARRPSGR